MSFNVGSLMTSVLPAVMQGAMTAGAVSSPQGLLLSMFLQGGGPNMGPGGNLSGNLAFGTLTSMLGSVIQKLTRMRQAGVTMTPSPAGEEAGVRRKRRPRDTSQSRIDDILNGNYSIEEKIILIAGIVSDSVTDELNGCLKEQGKMAKKSGSGQASTSDVSKAQNVENRIQILMQRLNRMQSLASNIIQATHATKKAQIMNIRV